LFDVMVLVRRICCLPDDDEMNKQFNQALEGSFAADSLDVLGGQQISAPARPRAWAERAFETAIESDATYFDRRAREERAVAQASGSVTTRGLHLELASRYAGLAAAIREAEAQVG
jgi:hypothetical protein